jgi:hypothetical protein
MTGPRDVPPSSTPRLANASPYEDETPSVRQRAWTPPKSAVTGQVRPLRWADGMYPGDELQLRKLCRGHVPVVAPGAARLVGAFVPHGPLAYVGSIIGAALGGGVLEETVVVLAPSHSGRGPRGAILADGGFAVPGGVVPIDGALAESIRSLGGLTDTRVPFEEEHAIEVLLPLLLTARPRITIVPMQFHDLRPEAAARIGAALADAIVGKGRGVTLVATSNLAHYALPSEVETVGAPVLEAIAALDVDGFIRAIEARLQRPGPTVEMCGLSATLVAMHALRALDAPAGRIVARGSSADQPGEAGLAVGYGAIAFPAA